MYFMPLGEKLDSTLGMIAHDQGYLKLPSKQFFPNAPYHPNCRQ